MGSLTPFVCLTIAVAVSSTRVAAAAEFESPKIPKAANADKRLDGGIFRRYPGLPTMTVCEYRCLSDGNCKSYNFLSNENGTLCELNDASATKVVEAPGYIFNKLPGVLAKSANSEDCSGQPCKNGAICLEPLTEDGERRYLCLCEVGWTGEHCDEKSVTTRWSKWSDYSACSKTCGVGWHTRNRQCISLTGEEVDASRCYGAEAEIDTCVASTCPTWEKWGEWSECSTVCGAGKRKRNRGCAYGNPGDGGCEGPKEQYAACQVVSCGANFALRTPEDGEFGEGAIVVFDEESQRWGGVCIKSSDRKAADLACVQSGFSGLGHMKSVPLEDTDSILLNAVSCPASARNLLECDHDKFGHQTQKCDGMTYVACKVDGGWTPWTNWSPCSVTCDHGTRTRNRSCSQPPSLRGGSDCEGAAGETESCTMPIHCPIDGVWREWSSWGRCTKSCGGGTQIRQRLCVQPQYLGKECEGGEAAGQETQNCNVLTCTPTVCHDWWLRGNRVSQLYHIDPDGETGPIEPLDILCDMRKDGGYTLIEHEHAYSERVVNDAEGAQELELYVFYNATKSPNDDEDETESLNLQLAEGIITESKTCRQHLKYDCLSANLHSAYGGDWVTTWGDRHKVPQTYFAGATLGSDSCACGLQGSCFNASLSCNCDANDEMWHSDEGWITNKTALPVIMLFGGDTGGSDEKGIFHLGPLECTGMSRDVDMSLYEKVVVAES